MNLFGKLKDIDQGKILDYIDNYGSLDSDSNLTIKAPLSHILRFWDYNKLDLFRIFGGKELILTKQIVITKPQSMIEDELEEKMFRNDGVGKKFSNTFYHLVRNKFDHISSMYSLMYYNTLASNVYSGASFSIPTPDGHTIAVNNGCKVSKVLGKIAKAFNLDGYEEFRLAHSQCLNQKQLTGELCLSIHPLDYMTMSDNNCDWSSCMSWMDKGDYRQGTVEMMNSKYVVIAYLKSSEDMQFLGHDWNSKKWRCLYIVTPQIISAIRHYPYYSDELDGITLKWLRDLAQENAGWEYIDTLSKVRNYYNNVIAPLDREISLNFYTGFMYNDFHSEHNAYVSPYIPDKFELCFSGESECMFCGEDVSGYDEDRMPPSSLACNNCEDVKWCDECGGRIDGEPIIVDGMCVCSYCYDEHFRTCDKCEETYHEENMTSIYLRYGEEVTNYHMTVCNECKYRFERANTYGKIHAVPFGRWDTREVVDVENLTVEQLADFNIWYDHDYDLYVKFIESKASDEI